jgi:hypothetical protein
MLRSNNNHINHAPLTLGEETILRNARAAQERLLAVTKRALDYEIQNRAGLRCSPTAADVSRLATLKSSGEMGIEVAGTIADVLDSKIPRCVLGETVPRATEDLLTVAARLEEIYAGT